MADEKDSPTPITATLFIKGSSEESKNYLPMIQNFFTKFSLPITLQVIDIDSPNGLSPSDVKEIKTFPTLRALDFTLEGIPPSEEELYQFLYVACVYNTHYSNLSPTLKKLTASTIKFLQTHGQPRLRICIFGLPSVGKTTLLIRLKTDEFQARTTPTMIVLEEVSYKDLLLMVWDIGGQTLIRKEAEWEKIITGDLDGLIFVVDPNAEEPEKNLEESKTEFFRILDRNPNSIPILLLLSKEDLEWRLTEDQVRDAFKINQLGDRIQIFKVSAKTGKNVESAFDAFNAHLLEKRKVVSLGKI